MSIERHFVEWQATRNTDPAKAHARVVEFAKTDLTDDPETTKWLAASLSDDERKFFTAALYVEAHTMPQALYEPMLRAAVYETSPLKAQAFVEPCVSAFGVKKVTQSLIDYLEKGSNYEKTGAVNALHWTAERKNPSETGKQKIIDGEIIALKDYLRALYLNTFINNPDVDLRRSIITHVDLDTLSAGARIAELIQKAIKIARQHPDEYIRDRVEVQLHRAPSAYSLPPRKKDEGDAQTNKKSWWKQLWK